MYFQCRSLRGGLTFERDLRAGQRVTYERSVDPRSQREQAFDARLIERDGAATTFRLGVDVLDWCEQVLQEERRKGSTAAQPGLRVD